MEAAGTSKILVTIYQITVHYIPGDQSKHSLPCDSQISYALTAIFSIYNLSTPHKVYMGTFFILSPDIVESLRIKWSDRTECKLT
jgi:hypothetical protein